jgi:hypothetical protein
MSVQSLYISVYTFLIVLSIEGEKQSRWQLAKEKDGIKVYTKKEESSSFKSIKVEASFQGSWEKLANILIDVKFQKQWVYRTKNSYLLKKISNNEVLYYTETSLPWPVNNRYAVVRMKISYDSVNKVGRVVSRDEPDMQPAKNGLVRIKYYNATWEVKALEKNKLDITYYLEVHPGGSVPASVVNLFISSGPYTTFSNLAALLKK